MSYPNTIEDINTIKSNYLPLYGGSLTGNLDIKSGQSITFSKDLGLNGCSITHYRSANGGSELSISACSVDNDPYTGACLYLHTNEDTRVGIGGNEAGSFCIAARNGSVENIIDRALQGYSNGGLYWNGYSVTQIGFPDYSKYYPTAFPEYPKTSKAIFTAPVDGWLYLYAFRDPASWTLNIHINESVHLAHPAFYSNYCNVFFPLKKSDYVHVWCDNTENTWRIMNQGFFGCRGNV